MMRRLSTAVLLCLFFCWTYGLDEKWVGKIAGMNCTSYIRHEMTSGSSNKLIPFSNVSNSTTIHCPPWYSPSQENLCKSGDGLEEVLQFQPGTGQTLLLPFYCMTTSENLTHHRDVIGGCLYTTTIPKLTQFFPLPCNISKLNQFMCAGLNRKGKLCGKCQDGYAPAAYSYILGCVNCTDYSYRNWLKYLAIAFGPLTVFCVLIIMFHISATSPYLHGYILFCQLASLPTVVRLLVISHSYNHYQNTRWFINIYYSFLGIWSLDFFRLVYKPFCLHPHMTVLQGLLLDYLIALFPLILVIITYILTSLYNRNCKVIVFVWKPLRRLQRPVSRNLNIKTTLIESFSTLYLLAVIKIQSVSLDLLLPTPLYYADGTQDKHYSLYLAPDVVYFGTPHKFYALLALLLSVALVLIPTLLLFLYPCQCFQRLLNVTNCNFQSLRTYMDVFQGHYKDGTENLRDYRYFAGVFFVIRILAIVQFPLLNSYFSVVMLGLCVSVLTFTVAILHPQKGHTRYLLDSIFLSFLSVLLFSAIGDVMGIHNTLPSQILRCLSAATAIAPLLYFTVLVLYWITWKKKIPQKVLAITKRRVIGLLNIHSQHTILVSAVE